MNSLEACVTKFLSADITSIPQHKPCSQQQESQLGQQLREHSSDARDVWVRHRKTVTRGLGQSEATSGPRDKQEEIRTGL